MSKPLSSEPLDGDDLKLQRLPLRSDQPQCPPDQASHVPILHDANSQGESQCSPYITPAKEGNQSDETHKKESIKILITGKSGTSKSVIINGLVGRELIPERLGVVAKPRSPKLEFYEEVDIKVWSSPHLQDEPELAETSDYLKELERKCSDVQLIIYCLKMTETRFLPDNPDIQAMKCLTEVFGEECWTKKTVFALTFANVAAELMSSQVDKESEEEAFKEYIQSWQEIIKDVLIKDVKVQLSKEIKIVPAGHYAVPSLPGTDSWLLNLFVECSSVMNEKTLCRFVEVNKSRLINGQSFSLKQNEGKKIHEQVIPVFEWVKDKARKLWELVTKT